MSDQFEAAGEAIRNGDLDFGPADGAKPPLYSLGEWEPIGDLRWETEPSLAVELCTHECDGEKYPVAMVWAEGTAINRDGRLVPTELDFGGIVEAGMSPNLVYFPSAICFHPGAEAKDWGTTADTPLHEVDLSRSSDKIVMTVDTGDLDPNEYVAGLPPVYGAPSLGGADPWSNDALKGHGPAIADLIGGRIGDPERSRLTRVQYELGDLGIGYRMLVGGNWVRGFDTHSLLMTLKSLENEEIHVLNLSLGTVACPHVLKCYDPIGNWLFWWLKECRSRRVVVSAGNHETCVPSWPAAYAKLGGFSDGPEVPEWMEERMRNPDDGLQFYSVGSAPLLTVQDENGNQKRISSDPDKFSARGGWVNAWRPGENVAVAHHIYANTAWTGTSFAAPQVAAELARGATHEEILMRNTH